MGSGSQLTQRKTFQLRPVKDEAQFLEHPLASKSSGASFTWPASFPTRTEARWSEKEGKSEFPASGQLQITHLWFPETSSLSIHFWGEKNPPREKEGLEGMERIVARKLSPQLPFLLPPYLLILQISTEISPSPKYLCAHLPLSPRALDSATTHLRTPVISACTAPPLSLQESPPSMVTPGPGN